MKARRDRRSAERRWRATELDSDLSLFKARRNYTLHIMNVSRRTYEKQYIDDNSSDQGKLFRASKHLLNLQADKVLPPHTNALVLANEMGDYFVHEITAIRSKLYSVRLIPLLVVVLSLLPYQLLRVAMLSLQNLLLSAENCRFQV